MTYAHSRSGSSTSDWQTLQDHCKAVAELSESFADSFASGIYGRLVGELHDVGKARSAFQSYLKRCNGIEDSEADGGDHSHSGAGACWLEKNCGAFGKALAYCVAGHHAGLPDWSGGEAPNGALAIRLKEDKPVLSEDNVNAWISAHESAWLKERLSTPFAFCREDSSLSFWIRMMYSCLVDADFLDTEAFMDPGRAALRSSAFSLATLACRTIFYEA